jgi:hypothetical protein
MVKANLDSYQEVYFPVRNYSGFEWTTAHGGVSFPSGHLLPPDCVQLLAAFRWLWCGFGNPHRAKWPERKS